MMTKMKSTIVYLAALSLFAAVGCKKDKKADEAAASTESEKPKPLDEIPGPSGNTSATLDTSLLEYVPADSPFVAAMLRPLPDDFIDYLSEGFAPLMAVANAGLAMSLNDEDMDPVGRAIVGELQGKLSKEGMESLGITLQPRMVFYAIGWSLAVRVQLADGKRFAALLDRVEEKSGEALPRAELGGISYREYVEDDAAIVFAVIDDFLVGGLMHVNARDKVLPTLLGLEKPAESMLSTGVVSTIVDKYKLMGVSTGMVDSQALARFLTGGATGLSKEIIDASQINMPVLSDVCKEEFAGMARVVPRMVFGYQSASAAGYEGLMSVELSPSLAGELAGLQTPSVNFEKVHAGKPLFAMGAAMNLDAAVAWARDKAKSMAAKPYQCEELQELNEGIAELAQELEQPLPPFVKGAHGMAMVLKNLEMSGFMPKGEGYAVIGVADPKALFEMAKQGAPPLAGVTLKKGEPKKVALGVPGLDEATLLLQDRWLGVAVGDGMAESMASLLKSGSSATSPFMVMAYDYEKMMKLSQAMDPGGEDSMDAEMIEMLGNLMGYSTTSMHFTRDGLLFRAKTDTTKK